MKRTDENQPLTRCVHPGPDADDDDGDCGWTLFGCGNVFPSSLKSS